MDDSQWQPLVAAANAASAHAYCPYSRFAVGAAVQSADGHVFTGCNIENASYGLAVCAERNAVFHAVAAGAREIVAAVIYTPTPAAINTCATLTSGEGSNGYAPLAVDVGCGATPGPATRKPIAVSASS